MHTGQDALSYEMIIHFNVFSGAWKTRLEVMYVLLRLSQNKVIGITIENYNSLSIRRTQVDLAQTRASERYFASALE